MGKGYNNLLRHVLVTISYINFARVADLRVVLVQVVV